MNRLHRLSSRVLNSWHLGFKSNFYAKVCEPLQQYSTCGTITHFDVLWITDTVENSMYRLSLESSILSAGVYNIQIYTMFCSPRHHQRSSDMKDDSGLEWAGKNTLAPHPCVVFVPLVLHLLLVHEGDPQHASPLWLPCHQLPSSARLLTLDTEDIFIYHKTFGEKPDKGLKKTINVYPVVMHDFSGSVQRTQGRCPQLLHSCSLALEGPN